MLQKADKIGDCYQITIPATIAKQCGIDNTHDITIKVKNHCLVFESIDPSQASLIAKWNENACHSEMYIGLICFRFEKNDEKALEFNTLRLFIFQFIFQQCRTKFVKRQRLML